LVESFKPYWWEFNGHVNAYYGQSYKISGKVKRHGYGVLFSNFPDDGTKLEHGLFNEGLFVQGQSLWVKPYNKGIYKEGTFRGSQMVHGNTIRLPRSKK